jgi:hypothetical protein
MERNHLLVARNRFVEETLVILARGRNEGGSTLRFLLGKQWQWEQEQEKDGTHAIVWPQMTIVCGCMWRAV